jgi:hypothetical protein
LANGGLQTKDALMEVLQIRDVLQDRKDIRRANPNSLLTFIGNTPLIQICRMVKHLRGVQIFAKAEWLNPGGSVKDRAGLRIIEEGEPSPSEDLAVRP